MNYIKVQTFPVLSPNSLTKNLILLKSKHGVVSIHSKSHPKTQFSWKKRNKTLDELVLKSTKRRKFEVCSSSSPVSDKGETSNNKWLKWLPKGDIAEKVFRLISSATSSPICQYISSPSTFLHSVDPRIKLDLVLTSFELMSLVWLLTLVVLPARSHIVMRFGLVGYLALLSIWILPRQVWMDQLGRVGLLSGILFIMLGFGSDGVPPLVQSRAPPPAMMGLPNIPPSLEGYSYLVMKLGPLRLTRKGLALASTSACLTFTIFQSANLCLSTTTPEQLAAALRWFMYPLTHIGVPVSEVILTLLLSLRFISLVFDEVRNAALGIVSRRIIWKNLTILETVEIFSLYLRRIFKNIFSHAEQITQAMIVRGFRGDANTHKIYFLQNSSFGFPDFVSLLFLGGIIGAAILSEYYLI